MRSNGDRDLVITIGSEDVVGVGSFHKTLPHNQYGEVEPTAFANFKEIIDNRGDFEDVLRGSLNQPPAPHCPNPIYGAPQSVAKLVSPQAGRASEGLGPDPASMEMPPAPHILGNSTAAEMTELYWMASLRDSPFDLWTQNIPPDHKVITDIKNAFTCALADTDQTDPGRLRIASSTNAYFDLPTDSAGKLDIRPQTLFRSGLKGEDFGPLVSQFFLHDAAYGTQLIVQKQLPYASGQDYLTDYDSWLYAQNTGLDGCGASYADDNDGGLFPAAFEKEKNGSKSFRRIATMRDLARFVNKDALHQAYFTAALHLLSWKAKGDQGNPYENGVYTRQAGFATGGGPHLLTLVSEVASRALKVVWRQKWLVHLRARPEVYGGLMQMQKKGHGGVTRAYGLPDWVFGTLAAQDRVNSGKWNDDYFLPMAFTAGSPAHPAYGAGHATVAGACVTVLKAWFDEDQTFQDLLKADLAKRKPDPAHPVTGQPVRIVQPGIPVTDIADGTGGFELPDYQGADIQQMTVGGELNKLASNVAMGRSMGGVHWRSDNTRSLRLGERIAAFILAKMSAEIKETPFSLSFTSFNNNAITIKNGNVLKNDTPIRPNHEDL